MKKSLKDITENECKQILKDVLSNEETHFNQLYFYKDGTTRWLIIYTNIDQDICEIGYDDTRVILWLYNHEYDITICLQSIENLSLYGILIDNLMTDLGLLSQGVKIIKKEYHKNFTMEYVLNKCSEIYEKYWKIGE